MKKQLLHYYKDKNGQWRWHLMSSNGNIVAESGGDGYKNLADAKNAVRGIAWRLIFRLTTVLVGGSDKR